jgi:hypothetical protein
MGSSTRLDTFVHLGEISFHEASGENPGRVSFDFTCAGEELQSDLATLVQILGSSLNARITAGRAGSWIGVMRFNRATLKPPDKKRPHVSLVVKGESFEEPERLQALMKLRLQASEFDLDVVTLVAEPMQQDLPFDAAPGGDEEDGDGDDPEVTLSATGPDGKKHTAKTTVKGLQRAAAAAKASAKKTPAAKRAPGGRKARL